MLSALGVPDELAQASVRFGLGRWTTAATVERAIARVARAVADLRGMGVEIGRQA